VFGGRFLDDGDRRVGRDIDADAVAGEEAADDAGGGGAGGDPPKPELAKVTLPGGVIIELPKDQAEAFMAARTKEKGEREELARKAGAAEAERKAASDQAAAAAQEKEVIRLAKDGEIAKVREMLTADSNTRLAALSRQVIDQAIEGAARRLSPGLADADVADMVALNRARAGVDPDTGKVRMLGDDGQPIMRDGHALGADAFLAEWLATRPRFQTAKLPGQGGGKPGDGGNTQPGTITRSQAAHPTPAQAEAMRQGKLVVVDG